MPATPLTLPEIADMIAAKGRTPGDDCVANHAGPHDLGVVDCFRTSTHVVVEARILPDGTRPTLPMCAEAAHDLIGRDGWQVVAWDALRHLAES